MYWFESAGSGLGRINIQTVIEGDEPPSWMKIGKYKQEFFKATTKVVTDSYGTFILGGNGRQNCL